MRHAPPVQVRCCGSTWLVFQSLCMGLAMAAGLAWLLLHAGWASGPVFLLAAGAAVLAVATAGWTLRHEPQVLAWDGQQWRVDGQTTRLELMLDLGLWLLLRSRPDAGGPARWLALSAADAGPALHSFCAALYAQAWARRVDLPQDPRANIAAAKAAP